MYFFAVRNFGPLRALRLIFLKCKSKFIMRERHYVKIGIAGPVGSGKTALIERLTRAMCSDYSIGVITNDIYTKEDAEFLTQNSLLPPERIIGVETGGCPHT